MKFVAALTALVALSCAACAADPGSLLPTPPAPGTYYQVRIHDYATDPHFTQSALQAVEIWNLYVGAHLDPMLTESACVAGTACFEVWPMSSTAINEACGGCDPNDTIAGVTGPMGVWIDTSPQAVPLWTHIMVHEYGHAQGLSHVNNINAVMYPTLAGSAVPTYVDYAQYWALRANLTKSQE